MPISRQLITICLIFFSGLACASDDSALVQTTTVPMTLYHWFNAASSPKLRLATRFKSSDPKGLAYLSEVRLSRWVLSSESPVTLRWQGGPERAEGNNENWVLLELHVSPGFKTIEATPNFLSSKSCPVLNPKSAPPLPPECLSSLERTTISLGLNGFKLKTGEIVLTNGKYFHSGEVRLFNPLSTDATQERLKIQSLFYKADFDHFKIGLTDSLFPSEISRLNPPFSGGGRGLLWDDLDGKPLDLDH
jgi:hypothetical protein